MNKRVRFDGYIHFPNPLFVADDAMGKAFKGKVGEFSFRIHFPVLGTAESGFSDFLVCPPTERRPLEVTLDPPLRWGQSGGGNGVTVDVVRITGLTEDRSPKVPDAVSKLQLLARPWFDSARDWIAALSGQPRITTRIPRPAPTVGLSYGRSQLIWKHQEPATLRFYAGLSPATVPVVERGLRMASLQIPLPLYRTFLLDARDASSMNDTRRACIDAGTAVEVVLSGSISKELKRLKTSDEFLNRAIVNANGAVGLVRLHSDLGLPNVSVSTRMVMNQLAEPRNQAAHSGSAPSPADANRAIHIAQSIVDAVMPL